jgi:hypothetical protein
VTTSEALQTRVKRLEAVGGDGGGCDRCRGTLLVVSDAISGEFHSASWNGEPLDEVELDERQVETRCPKCCRRIDPDETTTITVGGRREPG